VNKGLMKNNRGFTLIELLTVMVIIGILASIAVPGFQRSIVRAKEASLRNSLFVMRDVIDQYYADQGQYPMTLEDLAEKRYIREIPVDPHDRIPGHLDSDPAARSGDFRYL
jgi:general secretion pathway protein G